MAAKGTVSKTFFSRSVRRGIRPSQADTPIGTTRIAVSQAKQNRSPRRPNERSSSMDALRPVVEQNVFEQQRFFWLNSFSPFNQYNDDYFI